MPIDLLEQGKKQTSKKDEPKKIQMHKPIKDQQIEEQQPPPAKKPSLIPIIAAIVVILVFIIGAGGYYIIIYLPSLNINVNQPTPTPITRTPTPEPTPTPGNVPSPLPPTPLAPLYGTVINFADDPDTLYLIEDNGELRWIDRDSVVFENGLSINDISPDLIHTINDKWKTIRKGSDVVGLVDWDPRVLKPGELDLFL